ncbi:hypothetical protein FKW77_001650 [Venturia effusa]|uniref:Uncharacterized protein n=1 Tax=Venturia effusa TaxID=50376 RepID=A0A517LAE5_9PEZI|nr:hypothetical protein FKW77_001650 [Venturia effusa]
MTNNNFVSRARKVLHLRPSTTVGSLFGKNEKEKKSVKQKLRKILHLGQRVRTRNLAESKQLHQISTIDREPAGRSALEISREVISHTDVPSSTKQDESDKRLSSENEVNPLARAFVSTLNRLSVSQETQDQGLVRRSVDVQRRLTACEHSIDFLKQPPRKMGQSQMKPSLGQESEDLQDILEFSITPPGSPPKIGSEDDCEPTRRLMDACEHDVTDGHQCFSNFRAKTLVDNILSTAYQPLFSSGSVDKELDPAKVASGTTDAGDTGTQYSAQLRAGHAFCDPKKADGLAGKGENKPLNGLPFTNQVQIIKNELRAAIDHPTHKNAGNSVRNGVDDPSQLLLRRSSNDKLLRSPDRGSFRDSGYASPFKPNDGNRRVSQKLGVGQQLVLPRTPTSIYPAINTEDLSLALVPIDHGKKIVQPQSPDKIDDLTIKFANRAIKYLELGLDYLIEQSNAELHAQKRDLEGAYDNQITVDISAILSRAALMRPDVQGTPIVSRTRDFEAPAAAIEIDDRILLNLPEEEQPCVLRIGTGKDGRVAYYLNLLLPVHGCDGRMEELTIVSQMDVTSVVEQLALQEYHAHTKSEKSENPAEPLDFNRDNWLEWAEIEQADKSPKIKTKPDSLLAQSVNLEGVLKRVVCVDDKECTKESLDPPGSQMRRLLAFFLKLGSEHQECAVFAGEKPPGWEDIHWQSYWVSRDIRENEGENALRYEKAIEEYKWSQIQYKLDDHWESFVWRETVSWGKDYEQRRAYFVPMADRWSVDEKDRKKWWLMFLSDFDEDAWSKERLV